MCLFCKGVAALRQGCGQLLRPDTSEESRTLAWSADAGKEQADTVS